jgi:hypothetical protein
MNGIANIVNELKQQRGRLDAAIRALEAVAPVADRSDARKARPKGRKRLRRMSAAAKQRISAMMKARWKRAKKAGKKSL